MPARLAQVQVSEMPAAAAAAAAVVRSGRMALRNAVHERNYAVRTAWQRHHSRTVAWRCVCELQRFAPVAENAAGNGVYEY